MAMHMARDHLEKIGLGDTVVVSSRGLTDRYSPWGSPADPRAARALRAACGLASDGHASRLLRREELESCTACFYVTDQHIDWIAGAVGDHAVDTTLASKQLRKITGPGGDDVPDPFFADDAFYEEVTLQLEGCVVASLDALLDELHVKKRIRK